MIKEYIKQIISELTQASELFDDSNVNKLVQNILSARAIVCAGAGRMGYVSRAFAMRLSHLGLQSFFYQDTNLPHLSSADLLIIASGSGQTPTMLNLAQIANNHQVKIALVTCNPQSSIAQISHLVIKINTPSKYDPQPQIISIQPMTTLTEQFLLIFYDGLVLILMKKISISNADLWNKHSNLE